MRHSCHWVGEGATESMDVMDVGAFLITVVAVGFAAAALLGLGWLAERALDHDVRRWVKQLRNHEARRNGPR